MALFDGETKMIVEKRVAKMTTHANLDEANAECEKLRLENRELKKFVKLNEINKKQVALFQAKFESTKARNARLALKLSDALIQIRDMQGAYLAMAPLFGASVGQTDEESTVLRSEY